MYATCAGISRHQALGYSSEKDTNAIDTYKITRPYSQTTECYAPQTFPRLELGIPYA